MTYFIHGIVLCECFFNSSFVTIPFVTARWILTVHVELRHVTYIDREGNRGVVFDQEMAMRWQS